MHDIERGKPVWCPAAVVVQYGVVWSCLNKTAISGMEGRQRTVYVAVVLNNSK